MAPLDAYRRVEKRYKVRYLDSNHRHCRGNSGRDAPSHTDLDRRSGGCGGDNANTSAGMHATQAEKQQMAEQQQQSKGKRKRKTHKAPKPVRAPLPDLSQVLDFQDTDSSTKIKIKRVPSRHEADHTDSQRVYTLEGYEDGFFFLPGLISDPQECCQWIRRSLLHYPNRPNRTNIFDTHVQAEGHELDNLWERAHSTENKDEADTTRRLLHKMSWCTLGVPYNWTDRRYNAEDIAAPPPFPMEVAELTVRISRMCGYEDFRPEAAIVNFYHADRHMGGHLDDSEHDMSQPIVSLSFGHDAIFLLGGETRQVEPVAMRVRNGDVMVMGGRSRRCYHGVARIIEDTLPHYLREEHCHSETMRPFCRYLTHTRHRININVRQVQPHHRHGSNDSRDNKPTSTAVD